MFRLIHHLIGRVFSGEDVAQQYFAIAQRLEAIHQLLHEMPAEPLLTSRHNESQNGQTLSSFEASVDISDEQFCDHVLDLKQHILAGDIFQVVPSRTFSLPCPSPLLAYAKLKESNPSPYMFFMQDAAFSIFGASPESALKYER